MSETKHRVAAWFAGLLPAIGLLLLVARAEVAVHQGPTFRIPIRGYDPRDILHGQYLRYQFDFQWDGEDTCGTDAPVPVQPPAPIQVQPAPPAAAQPDPTVRDDIPRRRLASSRSMRAGCCLCVTRGLPNGFAPTVRHVDCGGSKLGCDGWIRVSEVMPPLRYFVPEESAQELQRVLNEDTTAPPSIELTLPPDGKPAIKELYLGDRPWREVLKRRGQ